MFKAALIGAIGFTILLVFAVRGINRRNAEFQKQLDAPKGHVSPAFLETALLQAETHLHHARAGSNVRFEMPGTGVLTLVRKRDRNFIAGYILRWEDRRAETALLKTLHTRANEQGLPSETLSHNKLEITFPDDYLRLETFIEDTCGALDHDDMHAILTWVCKGLRTQKDTPRYD
ncbi:hypothetical protein RZ517_11395 [Roseovarius sp. S88]|uniref:Uncharacterized protein n=2 Tax=Roseovarius phycicola TaxID=3080976 RepID=A0ABZ2HHH1_9RHOB